MQCFSIMPYNYEDFEAKPAASLNFLMNSFTVDFDEIVIAFCVGAVNQYNFHAARI